MAERRMMAKSVIETDMFMDMPMSTQCLYFHLLLRADDDGFIRNPSAIRRETGCSQDDFKLLVAKQYIIPFESGVIVIRHWKIHNYIRKDMYHPTECQSEKNTLELDKRNVYNPIESTVQETPLHDCNEPVTDTLQDCDGAVTKPLIQDRLGKVRLGKDNIAAACARNANIVPTNLVYDIFSNNIHPITGSIEAEKLDDMVSRYSEKWVMAAIEEAAASNGRSVKYIEAVLERWSRDGFKAERGKSSGRIKESHSGNQCQAESSRYADYEAADRNQVHPWDLPADSRRDRTEQGNDS